MKKIVIVGNSDYSVRIKQYITEDTDWEVVAFSVESDYKTADVIDTIPIVCFEEFSHHFKPNDIELILGIGFRGMNGIREKLFHLYSCAGYQFTNFIHSSVMRSPTLKIGTGNIILQGVCLDAFVTIGNGNLLFQQVMISHDDCIGDFTTLAAGTKLAGNVKIGNRSFLGIGSTVKEDISIGREVFIGAASYVSQNISDKQAFLPPQGKLLDRSWNFDIVS